MRKIVSLTPAPEDVYACFKNPNDGEKADRERVMCFALVAKGEVNVIVPMVLRLGQMYFADADPDYIGLEVHGGFVEVPFGGDIKAD